MISFLRPALAAALLAAGAAASAAPFSTTYSGTIGATTLPGAISGQHYTLTLVMDNGGTTPNRQSWTAGEVTCVIWRINDAGNIALAHNIAAVGRLSGYGSLWTEDTGQPMGMFGALRATSALAPGNYTATGLPPGAAVEWLLINNAELRLASGEQLTDVRPSDGSIRNPPNWSPPQPFSGPCAVAAAPPAAATPVPGLGLPALALLGLGFAGLGLRRLRARP